METAGQTTANVFFTLRSKLQVSVLAVTLIPSYSLMSVQHIVWFWFAFLLLESNTVVRNNLGEDGI